MGNLIKKVTIVILILSLFTTSAFATEASFPDIEKHWAKDSIERLVKLGVINGYPEGDFDPDQFMSYAEFLKVAVLSVIPANEIKTVENPEHWVSAIYETAVERGIVVPSEYVDMWLNKNEAFKSKIPREEMASILTRLSELVLNESPVDTTNTKNYIPDFEAITQRRQYFVLQAYEKGLLAGMKWGFVPHWPTTRAEACAVIVRLIDEAERVEPQEIQPLQGDDIYIQEGPYKGRMHPFIATPYHYRALKSARFFKENGKYYAEITLPELPEGMYWNCYINAYTDYNDYMFSSDRRDFIAKTGYIKLEADTINDDIIKDIEGVDLTVWVFNDIGDMESHTITNNVRYNVLRSSHNSTSDKNWSPFDEITAFDGWGLNKK